AGAIFAGKWWLGTAAQAVVYHFTVRPVRLAFSAAVVGSLVRSAVPMLLGALIAWVPVSSGVLFVRLLCGDREAGVFAPPQQIALISVWLGWLGIRILQPHM